MSDMQPKGIKIQINGEEYGMRFTLNAIDDIQEHFDIPIDELAGLFADPRRRIANIRYLLALLINEEIDCENDNGAKRARVDERFIGRHITTGNMQNMIASIYAAFNNGSPVANEDDVPNGESAQA